MDIKKGDHVKVIKVNDQYTQDAEERKLIGQTGVIDDILGTRPMIFVRMDADAPTQPSGHHLFDFKRDELEIIPVKMGWKEAIKASSEPCVLHRTKNGHIDASVGRSIND